MSLAGSVINASSDLKLTAFLGIFVVVLTTIWFYIRHQYGYWKRHNIPFIKPTGVFGNLKDIVFLQKNPSSVLQEFYDHEVAKNQPAIGIYIFNRPSLLLLDLELVKTVLIKDFNKFSNRFSTSDPHSDPLGADNLFFVKNPQWKQIRVKLTPVFTSGKIKQMFPLVEEIGRELDTHLCKLTSNAENKSIVEEIKDINTLYSTDVIATVAYGVKANSFSDPNGIFRTSGKRIFDFTTFRALEIYCMFFLPKLVRIFGFKLFSHKTTEFLRDLLYRVLADRSKSGIVRNDLIDLLLNFKREAEADKEKKHFILEGDSLVAQASIFFSAGFETSSSTISFSLYELARHQDIQQRLRDEIRDMLVENDGILTYDSLKDMKYLDNIVREVLRFYPVMPFLDRECTLSQGESSFSLKPRVDFEIPHGMPIYIPLYSIHRDAKYFPEPERFNPDRFSPEEVNKNNMSAYMPFGSGPHNCIGERFGLLQTKVGLINFLKNHYVTPSDKMPTEMRFNPKALLLQSLDGIYLNIIHDPLV